MSSVRATSDPGMPIAAVVYTRAPLKGVLTPAYFRLSLESGSWWYACEMSAVISHFHEAIRLRIPSTLGMGDGAVLTCAARLPKEVTSLYPLDGGFFFTRKLGLMASTFTPMSCGLTIAPLSSSSSNFCCNSVSSFFGYHGTSFSLADGGRALGMLMTASTFPNAPLYFGRSGPNTLLN